jgi:hypothetical protein
MKNKIAKIFYDKSVDVLTSEVSMDAEGGVINKGYNTRDTFKGNVNFSNCKQIQEDYGLDYNIDVSITTNYNSLVLNDLIKYKDVIYKVTDIIVSDSHILVIATVWRQ